MQSIKREWECLLKYLMECFSTTVADTIKVIIKV